MIPEFIIWLFRSFTALTGIDPDKYQERSAVRQATDCTMEPGALLQIGYFLFYKKSITIFLYLNKYPIKGVIGYGEGVGYLTSLGASNWYWLPVGLDLLSF